MLQGLILKKVIGAVIKKIMEKSELRKMRKYVEEDNELDIQMKQAQKSLNKYGRTLENVEKDIAKLRADSHPPVFMKNDYKDIIKRLNKLEKRR
tara:strand:+ start:284 stop:565 length:282 start_codon:yes stop_codon:yes gene_type:complete